MLFDSNPSLSVFFIILGTLLSVPIFSYLILRTIDWLFPSQVINLEQPTNVPLENIGEISS